MLRREVKGRFGSSSGFLSGDVGETGLCSSRNLFSSPSTRFNRASRTSVLGPRFLGTASRAGEDQTR